MSYQYQYPSTLLYNGREYKVQEHNALNIYSRDIDMRENYGCGNGSGYGFYFMTFYTAADRRKDGRKNPPPPYKPLNENEYRAVKVPLWLKLTSHDQNIINQYLPEMMSSWPEAKINKTLENYISLKKKNIPDETRISIATSVEEVST